MTNTDRPQERPLRKDYNPHAPRWKSEAELIELANRPEPMSTKNRIFLSGFLTVASLGGIIALASTTDSDPSADRPKEAAVPCAPVGDLEPYEVQPGDGAQDIAREISGWNIAGFDRTYAVIRSLNPHHYVDMASDGVNRDPLMAPIIGQEWILSLSIDCSPASESTIPGVQAVTD